MEELLQAQKMPFIKHCKISEKKINKGRESPVFLIFWVIDLFGLNNEHFWILRQISNQIVYSGFNYNAKQGFQWRKTISKNRLFSIFNMNMTQFLVLYLLKSINVRVFSRI